jgi:hypothetical protein
LESLAVASESSVSTLRGTRIEISIDGSVGQLGSGIRFSCG